MLTFTERILEFADKHDMLPGAGEGIIACVSGGADSMCLLDVLYDISQRRKFTVYAAHFNHMLRGDESDRDEAFVRDHCAERGISFFRGSGDVKKAAKEHRLCIEEAARTLRYDYFTSIASDLHAGRIATAHTADDNIETMLLNLVRGAGTAGLSGIPPVRGHIIRPMLQVSREDVLAYLNSKSIAFIEDSSNRSDIYTRNRLRHSVVPVLRSINPNVHEAFTSAAELARADETYLSDLADRFISEQSSAIDVTALLDLPFAISSRVIRRLYGGNLSSGHVKAVLELCGKDDPSARLSLPGMTVFREYGRVVFGGNNTPVAERFEPVYPGDRSSVMIPGLKLRLESRLITCNSQQIQDLTINKSFTNFLFKYTDLCGRMSVRPRREGDSMRISGRNCSKPLKKLFIENCIPARNRAFIPVIADEGGVLAVYGIGRGERAVPQPGDIAIKLDFFEEL